MKHARKMVTAKNRFTQSRVVIRSTALDKTFERKVEADLELIRTVIRRPIGTSVERDKKVVLPAEGYF